MNPGIDSIAFDTPSAFLDLKTLAALYEKDPAGYYDVLGQERMSVPAPDEDPVTLGANAALEAIKGQDKSLIKTLYFATESGIDQSKAAGMYLHQLLELPSDCRVVELKQACYSGTFALRSACQDAELNPEQKSLIVAADIARYGLGSPGEPTQGAGAVAMLIAAQPRVMQLSRQSGVYAKEAMDFWRPNYKDEAFVDGQYSVRLYMKSLLKAYDAFVSKTQASFQQFYTFCFHLPFSTIAEKAFARLARHLDVVLSDQGITDKISSGVAYNRQTGNSYAASLYLAICSLLDNDQSDLANKEIALFSYGSGSMAEFFSGVVQPQYRDNLHTEYHKRLLAQRSELCYDEYKKFYNFALPKDGQDFHCPRVTAKPFRLAGIKKHKRIYEMQR